jgi:hypothetical protein
MKKTTAAYLILLLVVIAAIYKPSPYALVKSAIPYVVAAIQYTVGLRSDNTFLAFEHSDSHQIDVFDWVMLSPDAMTKTPPLVLESSN